MKPNAITNVHELRLILKCYLFVLLYYILNNQRKSSNRYH